VWREVQNGKKTISRNLWEIFIENLNLLWICWPDPKGKTSPCIFADKFLQRSPGHQRLKCLHAHGQDGAFRSCLVFRFPSKGTVWNAFINSQEATLLHSPKNRIHGSSYLQRLALLGPDEGIQVLLAGHESNIKCH